MRGSILFASVCFFGLLVGCGSTPSAGVFDDPQNSGIDTGTTGEDATGVTDSSATDSGVADTTIVADSGTTDTAKPDADGPLTLDNVCERLADAVCTTKLQGCCSSRGVAYDNTGCRNAIVAGCQSRVDAVNAGDATFAPAAFPGCAAAWSTAEGKCSVPILEFVKTFVPCVQLFNGKTAPGDTCVEDGDCHANAGQWVRCATDGSSECNAFTIPGKDAPCGYATATAAICDYGLACNYTTSSMGTCKPQRPTGAMCGNDYECGFGNYCAKSTLSGTCQVGLKAGSPCSTDGPCASGRCASGSCTDPNFQIGIPAYCSGS